MDASVLEFLKRQGVPLAPAPDAAPVSAFDQVAPRDVPADPPIAPDPPPREPSALEGLMSRYQQLVSDYGPEQLAKQQARDVADIQGNRFAKLMDNASGLMINNPGALQTPDAVPMAVKNFVQRRDLAQQNLATQLQAMQMDPTSPLAKAKIAGLRAGGVNLPDGSSPMVADAYVGGMRAGGEAQKPGAEMEASRASAALSRANATAKPQEIAIQIAGLQKDYDLKDKEIAAAAKQGDLNRQNELIKAQKQIDAEMTRLRANISAENTGDADWQIGDQFSGGIKKLPPAAQEVLKRSPAARAILDASARSEALIRKHPDGVLTGNDAADLHRWLSEMSMQLNSVWGMGIVKQANMPMLEEALRDPTHLSAIVKNKVKGEDFLRQLHSFQTMVKQRMASEAGATGALSPKPGGYYEGFQNVSGKEAGNGAAAPPFPGAIHITNGSQGGWMDPAESIPEGWRKG